MTRSGARKRARTTGWRPQGLRPWPEPCSNKLGRTALTRAVFLPVGDVDANLPGMRSGPPRPRVGETFHVTFIVNTGASGLGSMSARTEYDASRFTENPAFGSGSVSGSTKAAIGAPFAVNPNAEAFATVLPNATRWNDIDAFGAAMGIFDLHTQSFTAVSAGPASLLHVNEDLADDSACNIWINNPCMPFNSFAPCMTPPSGGYFTIAGSGIIEILP